MSALADVLAKVKSKHIDGADERKRLEEVAKKNDDEEKRKKYPWTYSVLDESKKEFGDDCMVLWTTEGGVKVGKRRDGISVDKIMFMTPVDPKKTAYAQARHK